MSAPSQSNLTSRVAVRWYQLAMAVLDLALLGSPEPRRHAMTQSRSRRTRPLLVVLGAVAVTAGHALPAAAAVNSAQAADAGVVAEWNAIAERTIFTEAATPIPASTLY